MFYLLDALLFLGFFVLLLLFGLAVTSPRRSIEGALLFAPLGFLGLWATLFYLAGIVGFLLPLPFWIVAIAFLLVALVTKRANGANNARRLKAALSALSALERVLLLYVVAVAALAFVLCLVPPSGADYDSLVYHLAVPAQWLRDGRVSQLAFDHHSYFPFVGEMLYALALGVRDAVFAKLFHWAMFVFGALSLVTLGKRGGGKTAGLLSAALFVSLPMAQSEGTTAYVDLAFSAFAWAGLALFCEALFDASSSSERTRRLTYLASGLFCGLCLGSKYFGGLIFGFLGLWLLVASRRTEGLGRERWSRMAWFALPALAVGGFWYARNFLWTGNPVFPFAYELFGGRGWTLQMAQDYNADQAKFGFGKSPFDLIVLPWRLAMSPLNVDLARGTIGSLWPFDLSPVVGKQTGVFDVLGLAFSIFVGPVLLATGVPALLAQRKGVLVGFLSWMFAFLWFFWALTSQQIRYLFPALGILCVLSGWVLANRLHRFPIALRVAGLCLALWMVFSPTVTLWRARGTFGVISGSQSPENYLRRTFAGYDAMQWIGANTPATSRVAVYGEPRDFYLPRPYFWADDPHNNLVPYASITTPAELVAALKSLGATHVLYNRNAARNGGVFGPPQPLFNQSVSSGELRPLYSSPRGFEVYELK